MNQSFTIMALAGSAAACLTSFGTPIQGCTVEVPAQDLADYKEQALQDWKYLNGCTEENDGTNDVVEYIALANNLRVKAGKPELSTSELKTMFKIYDLNEDEVLDLSDLVNAYRVERAPLFDVKSDAAPKFPYDNNLFNYMDKYIDVSDMLKAGEPYNIDLMKEMENGIVTRK